MDDILLWARSSSQLQRELETLRVLLLKWGLRINISKCQLLCWGNVAAPHVTIDGERLCTMEEGVPIVSMNIPIGPQVTSHDVLEAIFQKARACFLARSQVLHSAACLKSRMLLLDRTVWASMSWIIGIIHPTSELTRAINSFQQDCIVSMAGWKRRAQELYIDHFQRVQRMAILKKIFESGKERWGTTHLHLAWRFIGHRGRASMDAQPTCSGVISKWRALEWWENEQQLSGGMCHARRHYARMMGQQREIRAIVGSPWLQQTMNKREWAERENAWVQSKDIDWARGTQHQIADA